MLSLVSGTEPFHDPSGSTRIELDRDQRFLSSRPGWCQQGALHKNGLHCIHSSHRLDTLTGGKKPLIGTPAAIGTVLGR
jgi:hypothetical protein